MSMVRGYLRSITVVANRRLGVLGLLLTLVCRPAAGQSTPPADANLPILGLAGITFHVADLEKARRHYEGIVGLPEAFSLKDRSGRTTSVFFKINDDQYIEVVPGLAPGAMNRQVRVLIQSFDLKRLHATYSARALNPTAITQGPDGNPVFRVIGPDGATLDFIEYVPGSRQTRARGKFLDARRLSRHLQHVGIYTRSRDVVVPFYQEKLGFARGRDLPGGRGEYLEFLPPAIAANIAETKFPRLDPNNAATRAKYDREVMAAIQHVAIEVPDMRFARDVAQERGKLTDLQVRVHVGNNLRWHMHLFDPDGSCTELVENTVQNLPPRTVMAPGRAVAPPILPTTPGETPWPSSSPSSR